MSSHASARRLFTGWRFATALILAVSRAAAAQETVDPQAIVQDVEGLISRQAWNEAEQKLDAGDAACPQARSDQQCRLQLEFARGFLKQSQSEASPEAREQLLQESAAAYRAVLDQAPGHAATTHNLALVLGALGAREELEKLLAESGSDAPGSTATIAASLGDVQAGKGDPGGAYSAFARAAALTDDPSTKRKMIQAVRGLDALPENMPETVRGWEIRSPAIAAEAYAVMFRKQLAKGDQRAADSLMRWVGMAAQTQALSSTEAQAAFGDIGVPFVRQLIDYLKLLEEGTTNIFKDPKSAINFTKEYRQSSPMIGRFPWWRETMDRRHALGLAALSIGRGSAIAGNFRNAQYQFLVGLQVAPPIDEYMFSEFDRLVPLDLITELVWLQVRYPELDPSHGKFDALIGLMFEGKGGAYQARDLVAIQRHHSVLGPIFVARKQWKRGRTSYDNAIFQLKAAIRAATQREKEGRFHQALPGLKAQLADGYHVLHDLENELKARVDAAEAALDSDDLDAAEKQLSALIEISPDQKAGPVARQLVEILESRRAARSGAATTPPDWATATELSGLDGGFLTRQQFKFLADLATMPGAENRDPVMEVAWGRAHAVSTLIGMEDVLRLERMSASRLGRDAGLGAPTNMKIVPGGPRARAGSGQWLLSLPSSDLPFIASLAQQ